MKKFLLLGMLILSILTGAAAATIIGSWKGSGGMTTEAFSVAGAFRLEWECAPGFWGVHVRDAATRHIVDSASSSGGTGYTVVHVDAGSYYLSINAMGDWALKVLSGE